MKILLPVDGSVHTKSMLSYIAAHDELLGAGNEFVFFHAIAPVPQHAARFLDRKALDGYYADEAEVVFKPLIAFSEQQGWQFRTAHAVGHAVRAIADICATEKPDLIVMGTHGHSALANVILGSVATGVLACCKPPVLLVR
jgi:nucleotide-binding universal stress UspA family protein